MSHPGTRSHSRTGRPRRAFLRDSSLAVAAVAVPYLVPATVFGNAEKAAPSERIGIGHIGNGLRGGQIGGMAGKRESQSIAVCDVDKGKREKALLRYKVKHAYNDFRELLARSDIDAVIIAVPDHWHALISIAAAKAGKDIFCEKPLSLTVREARAMVNAVRQHNRVFQTGSHQRSDAKFRFACELVRNNRIGDLVKVNVGVGGGPAQCNLPEEPVPSGFDYDMWLGPAPKAPYAYQRVAGIAGGGWKKWFDYSGGAMTNWGAHHFDIAQWGMGMDQSGPIEIIPPKAKGDLLTYKYATGVPMYRGGDCLGSSILFTGTRGKVGVGRGSLKTWPESFANDKIGPNEIHLYESRSHGDDWLHSIKTREKPVCDVEIGCRTATVCHLGNLAAQIGRPIRWDPEKEEIIGDEAASRMLDRPKRSPWQL